MEVDFLHKEIVLGKQAVRIHNAGYSSYFEIITILEITSNKIKIKATGNTRTSWIAAHKLMMI